MQMADYQSQAVRTAIYPDKLRIIYPALGLANEAGEALGKIKKVLRDNHSDFDVEQRLQIADEIGDVLWYIAALAADLGTPMELIARRNLDKLNSRLERGVIQGSGDNR